MSLKSPVRVGHPLCAGDSLSSQTGPLGSIFLPCPASGLSGLLGVCELTGEGPLQAQGVVSGGWRAGHLGPWGWRQAQGRGESGQVIVYVEAGVAPALPGAGSLGACWGPSPSPPPLGFVPLLAGNDGEGVDEEDLDDLNDADDGAAHPQAQLAADVGQKLLDLQGRPNHRIKGESPPSWLHAKTPRPKGATG